MEKIVGDDAGNSSVVKNLNVEAYSGLGKGAERPGVSHIAIRDTIRKGVMEKDDYSF